MTAKKAATPAPSSLESPAHRDAVAKFRKKDAADTARDMGAIAVLERRAQSATKEIELPGGDVVPIRARLSRTDLAEYWRLMGALADAEQSGDTPAVEHLSNQIVGLVLVDGSKTPAEIAAWLDENPQAISDLDAAEIIIQSRRLRLEDLARQKRLQDFRPE